MVAALVVVVDQLTKWWAVHALGDGRVVDIVWTLRFNLVRNSGAAFSTGRGLGPLLGLGAVIVVLVLIRLGRVYRSPGTSLALGAVLGGAVGNLIDRAVREGSGQVLGGYVIDFIDVQWWPVWNVADMAIVCGGIALAWLVSREADPAATTDPAAPAPERRGDADEEHAP
jgi:signal peptidase II